MNNDSRLVWIDLEMTGLNPARDHIVEIATIITDFQLQEIAIGPRIVIQQSEYVLENMNEWVRNCHTQSGLLQEIRSSINSLAYAQDQTLAFIREYCDENTALLAGNSVWNDKFFLQAHMPAITEYLNYRIVDVTSIKELVMRWYPDHPQSYFKKQDKHRALDDIRESIEELRHYRTHFFRTYSI